jgi:diaminopimelate epimerase
MKISFTKMHGAGNDFIVVDDRDRTFPVEDRSFIARTCARRTGVGCDGILLIQPSASADFRMRFINPDGGEVDMCGNGARCIARLAFDRDIAPAEMTIETGAGFVRVQVLENQVKLNLTVPTGLRLGLPVGFDGSVDFVNTGVPHAVVRVDDLENLDVRGLGRMLRTHEFFAPEGTNANFVKVEDHATLSVRTYERGVEDETLACGTGAAAVALIAHRHGWVDLPVVVQCASGSDLIIDVSGGNTTLAGEAEYVFAGEIEYGNRV